MSCFRAGWLQLILSSLSVAASAQSVKVSAPMPYWPLASGENIYESSLAGQRVVYRADQDAHGVLELFSAPLDGSHAALKLSPSLGPDGDVLSFAVGPDEATVIFLSRSALSGPVALQRVPSDGSAPALVLASDVIGEPAFTPDGLSVLYLTSTNQLWVVPAAGGSARRLTINVASFVISPDGASAVLRRQLGNESLPLSVPIDGSHGPVSLGDGHGELDFRIRADGSWVVYRANGFGTASDIYDLYGVPMDGSAAPVKLNPTLTGTRRVRAFELSPDGTRVVYVADQARTGLDELFSVPADGSAAPVRIASMPSAGDVVGAPPFLFTPDGREVVFRADKEVDDVFRLYRVPVDGSASPVRLETKSVDRFALDPQGSRVVYLAHESATRDELFSAPLHAFPPVRDLAGLGIARDPVRLNADLVAGGTVLGFELTPDGRSVVYHASQDSQQIELYRARIDGGSPPARLNGPLVDGGNVGANTGPAYLISADSSSVLYLADQDVDLVVNLYDVPLDRSRAPAQLNAPLDIGPPAGDVREFAFSPDGSRFVYVADGDVDEAFELYGGALDGAAPIARLAPGLRYPGPWSFSPDGTRVVLAATPGISGPRDLFSTASDGSTSLQLLENGSEDVTQTVIDPAHDEVLFVQESLFTAPILGGSAPRLLSGSIYATFFPQITRDGRRVVFESVDLLTYQERVYSAPLDAGEPPLELSGDLVLHGSVRIGDLSPRGDRLVFMADKEVVDRIELYSAPVDGRFPPMKLSGVLVSGGDVTRFAISPDGRRVVYSADQELDRHQELYSVPIDGAPAVSRPGGPALPARVKLNGPLPGGNPGTKDIGVSAFAIDATGARVAFVVLDANQAAQLYGVPIDRSSDPVLLGSGVSDVKSFRFSPDGTRVVFAAAGGLPAMPTAVELFSVPADGSLAPVRITGVLVPGGSLDDGDLGGVYAISPDGRAVVYLADQDVDERLELYSRAIDGSGSPHKLNGPLVASGDVRGLYTDRVFAISPDSSWVLYTADQDQDEVVELYRTPLP